MPVKQSDLEHRIAEVATVQPGRLYPVSAEVAGRVVSTHFELGQGVRKGQVLIVLDDALVKLALAEAAQSKSLAELEVGHARQDLVRTRELAKLLTRERGDQLAQVAVDLQKAKDDLARSTALHRRKIASATELADAKARLQSLTAGHTLAATRLALEHTRQRLAVETAQHKLATAGVGLKVALNKLARTALERDRHRILAPADGVVVVKQSEVGQRTTVGGQLGQLAQVDRVLLEVGLTEAELTWVRLGVAGKTFSIDCRVPEIGWNKASSLTLIEPRLVPMAGRTRTYVARFLVSNVKKRLIPGMTVRVDLATGVTRKVIAIPRHAVREIHGRTYVFLARQGRAVLTPVGVAGYHAGTALIEKGLSEGDRLIERAPSTLGDSDPISEKGQRRDAGKPKRGKPGA